jgi:hypothetical protein
MLKKTVAAGVLLTAITAGCNDSTEPTNAPPVRSPSELTILRLAATAPPLFNNQVSFYAKKGDGREARIYFQDAVGGQGEEYLRLKVDGASLLTRPDGTPFAPGDSILITVTVVDVQQIVFALQPSGLRFDPAKPAELEIEYDEAGDDLNQDGVVDSEDDTIESTMAIWRQETPGGVFEQLGSITFEDLREVDVELTGFTRYAIAY